MPNRTMLYVSQQNGGMFSVADAAQGCGAVFFVHAGTGTDAAGYGQNPDAPFASLDYAIGNCTASKGDRIVLMPGHAESLATATSCVIDVAGVQVIGVGVGALQPTFTLITATTATISVTAANCRIDNVKVISDLADMGVGITAAATADGLVVENCWFTDGSVTKELVIGISIAAACDNVKIRNNQFTTVPAGGCASAIALVGATANSLIADNYVSGQYSTAAIDGATAAGTHIKILRNVIANLDTGAGLGVSLHASTTGAVCDNRNFGGKNTVHVVAAGCMVAENYSSNALGASGFINPAIDT